MVFYNFNIIFIAIVAVTPMETVKTMFIHDSTQPQPRFKGLIHGVSLIIKEEGIRGIYKGSGKHQNSDFFSKNMKILIVLLLLLLYSII